MAEPRDKEGMGADALVSIRREAAALLAGTVAPYEAGRIMWQAAIAGVGEGGKDHDQCHALWLLWGGLTDRVEVRPDETAEAEAAIRRAASEWLDVADDEPARTAFFDRWLYDEIGYERPA